MQKGFLLSGNECKIWNTWAKLDKNNTRDSNHYEDDTDSVTQFVVDSISNIGLKDQTLSIPYFSNNLEFKKEAGRPSNKGNTKP